MLRSMDAAVAGLRAHQNKMDVVGHNIANVNTFGYKAQTYTFKEAMYQTSSSSTGGTAEAAGANAAQYGYGALMGTIGMDMTASTPTYVGGFNATISGDGFFLVKSTKKECGTDEGEIKGNDFYFTRVGQFSLDSQGYIVDGDKNFVYGFMPGDDGELDTTQLVPLRMPVEFSATAGADPTISFDNLNADSEAELSKEISINGAGEILTKIEYEYDVQVNVQDKIDMKDITVTDTNKWTKVSDSPLLYECIDAVGEAKKGDIIDTKGGLYTKNGTQYEKKTSPENQTRRSSATVSLGKVAIATFQNPNGLTKAGSNYYTTSSGDNAGTVSATIPGGATPDLMTGYVEASNVDLAKEFSDMITTHRGFQSNTKMITVSDEMLSDLVAMKR